MVGTRGVARDRAFRFSIARRGFEIRVVVFHASSVLGQVVGGTTRNSEVRLSKYSIARVAMALEEKSRRNPAARVPGRRECLRSEFRRRDEARGRECGAAWKNPRWA